MKTEQKYQIAITVEYGRKLYITEKQWDEWIGEDFLGDVEDIMLQPLGGETLPDGSRASFSPFAFCAPEVIHSAVVTHLLKMRLRGE